MNTPHPRCGRIPPALKRDLRVMLLAKHARSSGAADAVDGNHAIYHHELRTTLEEIGLDVIPADRFADLRRPEVDFAIPLLNRAGFEHSEMLAPLLLSEQGVPYLGASPILRGLSDDKHLLKLVARARGVPTADWVAVRRGAGPLPPPPARNGCAPDRSDGRWVVKPNASSASWGVAVVEDWTAARDHADALAGQGHDVLVERWTPLVDVAVPVIGDRSGLPWLLPPMTYLPDDPHVLRSYEEKRGLVEGGDDPLVLVEDPALLARLDAMTRTLVAELWPFDYGRFEYRFDPATGDALFMEANLSCNLWSKKTISRSAASIGIDHASLVETIVAHSLARQRVRADAMVLAA
ncbi:phosphoribosylglycinamide synthetase [uncultured Sphingomonas sp.]|uniref:phosphoribosylglycinamide synthetase n=1 Tax=uncultured Sphingomonas sp. TaxID=158754 RepID=UPI0035CBFC5A